MNNRLFIGIPLPDQIKENIKEEIILPKNFKITKLNNLHITLLFLGNIDESQITILIDVLTNSIINIFKFNLTISQFGQFPKKGYPKIIYITGNEGSNELCSLAVNIRNNFSKIGFSDNKDFSYHITVGRLKYKTNEYINIPNFKNKYIFEVDKIILYKSDLTPQGPIYTSLWEGNLK